jgi:hypothetical protein
VWSEAAGNSGLKYFRRLGSWALCGLGNNRTARSGRSIGDNNNRDAILEKFRSDVE